MLNYNLEMLFTPTQRIGLIKQLLPHLDGEDWSFLDITLDQFQISKLYTFGSEKSSIIAASLAAADDSSLLELAKHFGIEQIKTALNVSLAVPRDDPKFWKVGYFRLFISHLAAEKQYAGQLKEELSKFGISGFVAHEDIEPTLEWQAEIVKALETCDSLLALLHPSFHVSSWTDHEIGFALGRKLEVFSVRLGRDPYGLFGHTQAFKGVNKWPSDLAEELFQGVLKHRKTRYRMGDVLLTLFEQSNSFAEAKVRISYLERLRHWEPTFASRIQKAVESNYQIREAIKVPDRVRVLAEKWMTTSSN